MGMVQCPIFMAFITTFVAGCAMLPVTTLAYYQIGLFMVLITTTSWLYSTFFFCALLAAVGPNGSCCQVRWAKEDGGDVARATSEKELTDGASVPELEPMVHRAMRRYSAYPYALANNRNKRFDHSSSGGGSSARRASMPVILANRRFSTDYSDFSTGKEFRSNHRKSRESHLHADCDAAESSRVLLTRRPLLGSGCSLKQVTADL
uniref:Uncharacterized protein n=2 Tax=Plectus sambesii TaxID=2011161 RepID=A0A914UP44_9BILA